MGRKLLDHRNVAHWLQANIWAAVAVWHIFLLANCIFCIPTQSAVLFFSPYTNLFFFFIKKLVFGPVQNAREVFIK